MDLNALVNAVIRRSRLRWFDHVERMDESSRLRWVRDMMFIVEQQGADQRKQGKRLCRTTFRIWGWIERLLGTEQHGEPPSGKQGHTCKHVSSLPKQNKTK